MKSNELYLQEIKENNLKDAILRETPYKNLYILSETKKESYSYYDSDGDINHDTRTVVGREILVFMDGETPLFISANWFDSICSFSGIYALVCLGGLYNLIKPNGEIVLPFWYSEVKLIGNNLICGTRCHNLQTTLPTAGNDIKKDARDGSCDLYDSKGVILFGKIAIVGEYEGERLIIKKNEKYNYIDNDGNIILKDWCLGANPFKDQFAFIETQSGWRVINNKGDFALQDCFMGVETIAEPEEWKYPLNLVAVVEINGGKDFLMTISDEDSRQIYLRMGFGFPVEEIRPLWCGFEGTDCMVKNRGVWFICGWDRVWNRVEKKKELGVLEIVGEILLFGDKCIRVSNKGKHNLVNSKGFVFDEWYSELLVYDFVARVCVEDTLSEGKAFSAKDSLVSRRKYNLLVPAGYALLDEWVDSVSVLPYDGFCIIQIDTIPQSSGDENNTNKCIVNLDNTKIKDIFVGNSGRNLRALEAYSDAQVDFDDYSDTIHIVSHNPVSREVAFRTILQIINDGYAYPERIEEVVSNVKKHLDSEIEKGLDCSHLVNNNISFHDKSHGTKLIQGKCKIIKKGHSLYDKKAVYDWYDAMEFQEQKVFIDGYIKVWKDGKCNLMDEYGNFASSEWVDGYLLFGNSSVSFYSHCINGAFTVRQGQYVNLLFRGFYLLDRWVSRIYPSDNGHSVYVDCGDKKGLYQFGYGLLGEKYFDSIKKLWDDMFLCVDGQVGVIITADGEVVSEGPFVDAISFYSCDYAIVFSGYSKTPEGFKYSYIDRSGRFITSDWYDSNGKKENFNEWRFSNSSFVRVMKEEKYNLLNDQKKLLFQIWYDGIEMLDDKWLICDKSRRAGMYNIIDNNGVILSEEWFDLVIKLRSLNKGYYVVQTDRGYNIIDPAGHYTLPFFSKERIEDLNSNIATIYVSGPNIYGDQQSLFISETGVLISPYPGNPNEVKTIYVKNQDPEKYYYSDNLYVLRLKKSSGNRDYFEIVCRRDGSLLIEKEFASISEFNVPGRDGRDETFLLANACVQTNDASKGDFFVIDINGKECIGPFDTIQDFKGGYAIVEKDNKYNLMNTSLRMISSLWFDGLGYRYKALEKESVESIDEDGLSRSIDYDIEKIKCDTSFYSGYLKVEICKSFNYINAEGKLRYNRWYDSINNLNDNYEIVRLSQKYNIIDSHEHLVSDEWFDSIKICLIDRYNSRYICACKKGELIKLLIQNGSSVVLSPVWVDKVFNYRENQFYPVCLKGKKNFIKDDGSLLMPSWYDDQLLFNNYVVVEENGEKNIYDSSKKRLLLEKWVKDIIITGSGDLFDENGLCCLRLEEGYTYSNMDGQYITDDVYDQTYGYRNGYAGVVRSDKKNYLNTNGQLISNIWFEEIGPFVYYKKAIVRIDGLLTIIDETGNSLFPSCAPIARSISLVNEKYCKLIVDDGSSNDAIMYFVYDSKTFYNDSDQTKTYLSSLPPLNNISSVYGGSMTTDVFGAKSVMNSRKEFCDRDHLRIITQSETGYYLVSKQGKCNLLDIDNNYILNEWIDPTSIKVAHDVVLLLNKDGDWQMLN